jgi:hypothetical protein
MIAELKFGRLTKHVKPMLGVMPPAKQKHSLRVAKTLNSVGAGKVGIYAGAYHDYIERGGNVEDLTAHLDELGLSKEILTVVQSLSSDEKHAEGKGNQPLEHIKQVLNAIQDQKTRDTIILVKIADRLDNLKKRIKTDGRIGRGYLNKSKQLLDYLQAMYTGKPKPFQKLLRKYYEILQKVDDNG